MSLAIENGQKNETRRLPEVQPIQRDGFYTWRPKNKKGKCLSASWDALVEAMLAACRYGKPGDFLYVKENLRLVGERWVYEADNEPVLVRRADHDKMLVWAHHKQTDYCPAMFMPRFCSRHLLRLKNVKVECLHQISESDALAEGCNARLLGELLRAKADAAQIYPYHWIHGYDEGIGFCKRCGENKVRELRRGKTQDERDEICLAGGYQQEEDGVACCETCGRMLDYTLTDYGSESELKHFEQYGISNTSREAYAVHRMLGFGGNPILTEKNFHPEWKGRVARLCFRYVWDRINKASDLGWGMNPLVYVLQFEKVAEDAR